VDKRVAEILLNLTYGTVEQMGKLLEFSHKNCDDKTAEEIRNLIANQMGDIKLHLVNKIYAENPDLEKQFENSYIKYGRYF